MTTGYREFEFDLPDALLTSMVAVFDAMAAGPLNTDSLKGIPEAQGVYQLLLGDEIVYIGKTDSDAGLYRRLIRHAWTIQHRCNLDISNVFFKSLRVFVFTAVDLETQLIRHYRGNASTKWNNSGFGSNDPGRKRDHTKANDKGFDTLYPIDLDKAITMKSVGVMPAIDALNALRRELPYTLRVEGSGTQNRATHPDLEGAMVHLQNGQTTPREFLTAVVETLPPGWQATALAGRIILYKERVDTYPGRVIARS